MESWTEVFDARTDLLEDVRAFVLSHSRSLSDSKRSYMDLALEEIFVNICNYAYRGPSGKVEVTVFDDGDSVSLLFVDGGVPFDPLDRGEVSMDRPMMDRPQGGLGIPLTRKVVDEIHYLREGEQNRLKLVLWK